MQLQDALRLCPELRDPLYKHAMMMIDSKMGNVPDQIMNILLGYDLEALETEDMVMQVDISFSLSDKVVFLNLLFFCSMWDLI
jgi:hypothetical protein